MDTLAVMTSIAAQTGVLGSVASLAILRSRFHPLFFLYYLLLLIDDRPFKQAGAPIDAWRRSRLWKLYSEFFSATLIKTVDIGPDDGPYIFGVHPHGILALSAPAMFGSEATGFADKFPGIDLRVAVVNFAFYMPIAREVAMACGCISADRESVVAAMDRGKSVAIYVGGADEALLAGNPSQFGVILSKRTGFVKIAMERGASLVPCITFGEHETYSQVFRPFIRKCQVQLMKMCGFSLPVFKPNYLVPLMPRRVKMTTIVGTPIKTTRLAASDPRFEAAVAETHQQYIEALMRLHAEHREKYGSAAEQKLEVLEAGHARQLTSRLYPILAFINTTI